MAGSRAWYVYSSDDGNQYAVELDEDAATINTAGFTVYSGQVVLPLMPKGMKMRYVNAIQSTGAGAGFRSRRIFCGTTESALFSGTAATVTVNGMNYVVSSTRGERQRKPKAAPTGLVGASPVVGGTT